MFHKQSFRAHRPPRASVIAGVVMLILAMGSTAYAASIDVIPGCNQGPAGDHSVINTQTGQQCNPFEKRLDDNQSGSQGPAGHADPAGRGPADPARPTSETGLAETKLFARLGIDGSVQAASSSVVKDHTNKFTNQTGHYQVGFNQPVDNCVPVATVHLPNGSNPSAAIAEVGYTSQTQIRVRVFKSTGEAQDSAFDLIVMC